MSVWTFLPGRPSPAILYVGWVPQHGGLFLFSLDMGGTCTGLDLRCCKRATSLLSAILEPRPLETGPPAFRDPLLLPT